MKNPASPVKSRTRIITGDEPLKTPSDLDAALPGHLLHPPFPHHHPRLGRLLP
uniref:Uncharacterized protein n=1 Tax=Arundo donax TaxID=35708 RepID=A0A0A8YKR1_ARUDO